MHYGHEILMANCLLLLTPRIFLKDLFSTGAIPGEKVKCCNRSRYSNPEFDRIVEEAFNTSDREKAKSLYVKAQEIVSNDLPLIPLWYPAKAAVSRQSHHAPEKFVNAPYLSGNSSKSQSPRNSNPQFHAA